MAKALRKKKSTGRYDLPCLLLSLFIFTFLTITLYRAVPSPDKHLEIDSSGYERVATHFEQTSRLECAVRPEQHPVQTLAYPLFLGLIYKICGHEYVYVVFFQYLLALLCGFLIFLIASTLFNQIVGCIAALLWSVNLGFLVYVQFLLTEILFVTCLLGFLYFFVVWWKTQQMLYASLAGLVLGLSVVVKPAALFFILPLSLFMLLFFDASWAKKIASTMLLIIFFYAPILGYMTRNYVCYGYFRMAPMMNEILYLYFTARIQGKLENRSHEEIVKEKIAYAPEHSFDEDGWQESREFLLTTLRTNPLVPISIWLTNVFKTFVGLFSTQLKVLLVPSVMGGDCSFFKTSGTFISRLIDYITCGTNSKTLQAIAYAEALWTIIRYILILVACIYLLLHKEYSLLIFFLMYSGYFTIITGHDGCARYRMMIEPLLITWAALGIWCLAHSKNLFKTKL